MEKQAGYLGSLVREVPEVMALSDDYRVLGIPAFQTHEWLLKKHYAHRIPSISYAFGLFDRDGLLMGVCTYGFPPSPPPL